MYNIKWLMYIKLQLWKIMIMESVLINGINDGNIYDYIITSSFLSQLIHNYSTCMYST